MTRLIKIIFPVFISMLLISCSLESDKLKRAGNLMETQTDSALHILQNIPSDRLITSSEKALYALLMSQALDKNDIKLESDSLIHIATDYYKKNDPLHAGYAWFYMARCANNSGNIKIRTDALLKAQAFAGNAQNNKLLGLVYADKGDMYKEQGQTDSSIVYYRLASRAFQRLKDNSNATICLLNTGSESFKKPSFDSVVYYYQYAEKLV